MAFKNDLHLKDKILSTSFREKCIMNYENRNNEIQNYFAERPQDILKIDVSEQNLYEKINIFLGLEADAIIYETRKNSKLNPKKSSDNNIEDNTLIKSNLYNYP